MSQDKSKGTEGVGGGDKYRAGQKRGIPVGASHLDLEELLSPVSQEWEGRKSTQQEALLGLRSTKSCCYPHWVCVCQKYQGCWNSRTYKSMLLCSLNYLDCIRTQVRGYNFIIHWQPKDNMISDHETFSDFFPPKFQEAFLAKIH